MIITFPQIETALQKGIALGLILKLWNADVLAKINGAVGMVLRRDTEEDIEGVFASGKFPERDGDVVSGVEAQVESENRFRGGYRTSQVLADFACLEHRQIGIKDVDMPVRARQHQHLTAS